jgi:SAM-dependent methyltransferase
MKLWNCPLCDSVGFEWLFDISDFATNSNRIFSIRKCRQCNLFSIFPRPQLQELLAYYPADYEPYQEPGKENWSAVKKRLRQRHYQLRCREVYSAVGGEGRLLDIGCGTGEFLVALLKSGSWQAIGIDINPYAVQTASRRGLDVRLGDLSDLEFPAKSFDAVTIWEAIEHLPNPMQTIEDIGRLLRPGGYLFLSTPNGDSLQARFWRKYWVGWDVPRHLQVFTPQVLCHLLEGNGFILKGKFAFPTERYFAVESIRRWIRMNHQSPFARLSSKIIPFLGVIAWPVFRLLDFTPMASSIALKFQSGL